MFAGKIRTRSECVKEFSNTDLKDSLTAVAVRWTATGADLQGHLDLQKDTRILCTVYICCWWTLKALTVTEIVLRPLLLSTVIMLTRISVKLVQQTRLISRVVAIKIAKHCQTRS